MLLALAGCSSLSDVDPVAWWHNLQGGEVAESRPPPPNADAPYRPLTDVPEKPPPGDPARRDQIAQALVSDRANAQYAASVAPLPPPSPGPLPRQAPPAAGTDNASSATLAAATAPPPPVTARPRRAPATPVATNDLPPPAAPSSAPAPPTTARAATAPADTQAAGLPNVPDAPPPPPVLPGVAQTTAPTPPPPTPPPAAVAAVPQVGAPVTVAFPDGSATLPGAALPGLKLLAQSRGAGRIAVVGYGGANGSDPAAQAAAMPLALARARAVAANLLAAGVPNAELRIDAEAVGNGAVARVVN